MTKITKQRFAALQPSSLNLSRCETKDSIGLFVLNSGVLNLNGYTFFSQYKLTHIGDPYLHAVLHEQGVPLDSLDQPGRERRIIVDEILHNIRTESG